MKRRYQNPDLTEAMPELAPEIIASGITPDPVEQEHLCERLHRHWRTNQSFRNSFKRRDPRDVCHMWMKHWSAAFRSPPPRRKAPTAP